MNFQEFFKTVDLDNQSLDFYELFYDEGYKQGWKNAVEASPISDIWNDEEDGVWEAVYNKQMQNNLNKQ